MEVGPIKAKYYRFSLLILGLLVLAVLAGVLYYENWRLEHVQNIPGLAAARQIDSTPSETSYVLREYNGKIGVFYLGQESPFQILDVYLSTLPVADQAQIREGIYVEGGDALRSIIEDYES